MKYITPILYAALASAHIAAAQFGGSEGPVLERRDGWTTGNCYSTPGSLTKNATSALYQTDGLCETLASSNNAKVVALFNGDTCYYGNEVPPNSDQVDDSQCSTKCLAWSTNCGGPNAYRVYYQGSVSTAADVSSAAASSTVQPESSAEQATTPAAQATTSPVQVISSVVAGGTTVVVTQTPDSTAAATVSVTPTSTGKSSGGGTNTAAIAAGVVVGIVAVAALAGGVFFYLRSKKHRDEAAELHRANSQAGLSARAEKPASTYSLTDSRLEPTFMRRISDGSIADNQDYSRRILKVANPDDR